MLLGSCRVYFILIRSISKLPTTEKDQVLDLLSGWMDGCLVVIPVTSRCSNYTVEQSGVFLCRSSSDSMTQRGMDG